MIYAVYVVAAIAICVLIGFVMLSVKWLKRTVLRNIRSKTIGLLSVYDDLLEEKSQELSQIVNDNEKVRLETAAFTNKNGTGKQAAAAQAAAQSAQSVSILEMTERRNAISYRERSMSRIYRTIRKNFSFSVDELLPGLEPGVPENNDRIASRLISELDFDTVYRLSTLPPEFQLKVLKESLSPEETALLNEWMETTRGFNALRFYDYLQAKADEEPQIIRLRVPDDDAFTEKSYDGLEIVLDESICEGFQLEANHLLYDYCIKTRELS